MSKNLVAKGYQRLEQGISLSDEPLAVTGLVVAFLVWLEGCPCGKKNRPQGHGKAIVSTTAAAAAAVIDFLATVLVVPQRSYSKVEPVLGEGVAELPVRGKTLGLVDPQADASEVRQNGFACFLLMMMMMMTMMIFSEDGGARE